MKMTLYIKENGDRFIVFEKKKGRMRCTNLFIKKTNSKKLSLVYKD